MSASRGRIALPLCRWEGHTCAACCWGAEVPRSELQAQLRRQTRLFQRWFPSTSPLRRLPLLVYEVLVRRGWDLVWGLLLWVPGFNVWMRPRLKQRIVCAFVGFEDLEEQRVGCLIHPSRWNNQEMRPRAAFALLRGMGCGSPSFYCLAAHWFARASWEEQARLIRTTAAMDWYQFSETASAYRPREGTGEDHGATN